MSDSIERVRFTSGLPLGADDFRTDQDYHRRMRWLHNRTLHGTGVVTGFDISIESLGDGVALRVSPGFAIDRLGRELMSDRVVEIAVPGAGEPPSSDALWIVAARHRHPHNTHLVLAATNTAVTRIIELTGAAEYFTTHTDLERCLRFLDQI